MLNLIKEHPVTSGLAFSALSAKHLRCHHWFARESARVELAKVILQFQGLPASSRLRIALRMQKSVVLLGAVESFSRFPLASFIIASGALHLDRKSFSS